MSEHEHDAEEQVEDLDVPEAESEDVKGGAADIFAKAGIKGNLPGGGAAGIKLNPGGLNFEKQ